jgi:uncharacterized caspase-like protein
VTAIAIDADGIRSRPASVDLPPRPSAGNRLHVIAVGIDSYTFITPLNGAATDARTLVRTLGSKTPYYTAVQSVLLVDGAATAAGLQRSVDAAVSAAGPDDTILFFYAGHGARTDDGRFYMTTSETDPDRLPETSIDWQAISETLGRARGRVIVVIDACHAGQTGRAGTTNDEAVSSITSAGGAPMVVLAASKGRQLSEELRGQRGGVFTQTLARVLADGRADADLDRDGTLSISEVYGGVKRTVELQTDGRQTPWLVRRNIVGDAPLF